MISPPKLNDIFPDWLTGAGIFATLQNFNIPWKLENISADLDLEYHGNHSGDKLISPVARRVSRGEPLTVLQKTQLASALYAIYNKNWVKQWNTLSFTYNPIENYSMTEVMTNDSTVTTYGKTTTRTDNLTHQESGDNTTDTTTSGSSSGLDSKANFGYDSRSISHTNTRTDNLSHGKTGTDTTTPNTTDTTTPNLTTMNTNSVYGFNSTTGVNSDTQNQTATGTNTTTHTGTEQVTYNTTETNTGTQQDVYSETNRIDYNSADDVSHSNTQSGTENVSIKQSQTGTDTGTQTRADTGTDTHTRNYSMTRSGNIGVTTSQEMIKSERELWLWNFFQDVVFPDIDKFLTLQVY